MCTPGLLAHAHFCPTCSVTQPLPCADPVMPVWLMRSPPNADYSQASRVWRASQVGGPGFGGHVEGGRRPGTPRRCWLWRFCSGAPASFSVGEWILQALSACKSTHFQLLLRGRDAWLKTSPFCYTLGSAVSARGRISLPRGSLLLS